MDGKKKTINQPQEDQGSKGGQASDSMEQTGFEDQQDSYVEGSEDDNLTRGVGSEPTEDKL